MLLRLQSALGPVATYGDPSWRVDTVKQVARCPADLLGQFVAAEMLHLELSGKGCMLLLDLPFPKRIIYAYVTHGLHSLGMCQTLLFIALEQNGPASFALLSA